ncbi:MAG TPA: GNAT family N-acetyltransferase [Mucilaginibacter sp.]
MSNQAGNKYRIERLGASNIPAVAQLHTAVYGRAVVPGFFQKKYATAFTGVEYTGYIAYQNDQPTAFYAVIPCYIICNDELILSAQSADTMTHPGHRNKGLFVELALTTFQLCKELGIKLLFGFPNQNSLPGFVNKLGWQTAHTMDCFIIHTSSFSWKATAGKIPVIKTLLGNYKERVLKKYRDNNSRVSNSVHNDGYGGVYRDDACFAYKTYTDTFVTHAAGSTLWLKANSILLIGDVNVNADSFDDMIYELKKLAGKLGIKQIHFHASPGTTLHGLFAMRFNSIPSFPVIFKLLGEDMQTDKIKFTSADVDTF